MWLGGWQWAITTSYRPSKTKNREAQTSTHTEGLSLKCLLSCVAPLYLYIVNSFVATLMLRMSHVEPLKSEYHQVKFCFAMLSDTAALIIFASSYSNSPVNCCTVGTNFLTVLWKWSGRPLTSSVPLSVSLWAAIPPQNYTITTNNHPPCLLSLNAPWLTQLKLLPALILRGSISKVY